MHNHKWNNDQVTESICWLTYIFKICSRRTISMFAGLTIKYEKRFGCMDRIYSVVKLKDVVSRIFYADVYLDFYSVLKHCNPLVFKESGMVYSGLNSL